MGLYDGNPYNTGHRVRDLIQEAEDFAKSKLQRVGKAIVALFSHPAVAFTAEEALEGLAKAGLIPQGATLELLEQAIANLGKIAAPAPAIPALPLPLPTLPAGTDAPQTETVKTGTQVIRPATPDEMGIPVSNSLPPGVTIEDMPVPPEREKDRTLPTEFAAGNQANQVTADTPGVDQLKDTNGKPILPVLTAMGPGSTYNPSTGRFSFPMPKVADLK